MKRISLTNGGYALVDNEDFDFLTPEEAFACYSNAALTYHQDFANLARKRG